MSSTSIIVGTDTVARLDKEARPWPGSATYNELISRLLSELEEWREGKKVTEKGRALFELLPAPDSAKSDPATLDYEAEEARETLNEAGLTTAYPIPRSCVERAINIVGKDRFYAAIRTLDYRWDTRSEQYERPTPPSTDGRVVTIEANGTMTVTLPPVPELVEVATEKGLTPEGRVLLSQKPCPDCNGSGVYVGLGMNATEVCRRRGGGK